ncbi:ZYBA0S07-01904g1_1 [Zygosaccharomyces bailii CLIB 213]|uniref:ZYBA0S07-01904g1_1 n=1 Tax=Zygosaccharomyces bailii (strain CLIB 213 / ATCC 58445 / CBS 680 / BCRC 21525 / NBRC 1098 / NCYC 1416 / NRRL Y-2227) TaxID=1333698 RepID=A0A8J2X988_ZYGB2|nr:ZYBA0S07-01904g1_1 [Zygosaccharomyces bailii CLIB 213]
MGVHSFWDIVGPTARPVRLEALQDRKMAVDASIWIYQFLKAVRDPEGNSLKYSHIIGFFRRICKLLYFGIKPVFVFDGGVPALKLDTIRQRRERRQGKRDSATVTARKLLAIQLQKQQETEKTNNTGKKEDNGSDDTSELFRPQDEWHLPHIPGFKYDVDDERVVSANNYEKIVNSMDDELEGIDLDSINPRSAEFDELPKSTQYMILSTLRLRSRLRMGYTKEQLEQLFPDSMDFSKFQIDMVKRRNFFTQKLMNVTGLHDGGASNLDQEVVNRISGQLHKEYKLTKTDSGWSLGLGELDGSETNKAILLDDKDVETLKSFGQKVSMKPESKDVDEDQDEENFEWEDVDIKPQHGTYVEDYSLNAARLPQLSRESSSAGGKSFLDSRPAQASPMKRLYGTPGVDTVEEEDDERSTIFTSKNENNIMTEDSRKLKADKHLMNVSQSSAGPFVDQNTDEDAEEGYLQQIEEIELMEAIQRSRRAEHIRNEKNSTMVEANASQHDHKNQIDPHQSIKKSHEPGKPTFATNKKIPTQSEQNLNAIVSKIPEFSLGSGGSFLFQGTEHPDSKTGNELAERKPLPETPTWFRNIAGEATNPFATSNFVQDREVVGSDAGNTNDILQRVTGLEEGQQIEVTRGSGQDDELLELQEQDINDGTPNDKQSSDLDQKNNEGIFDRKPLVFDYDFSEEDEEYIAENMRKEEREFSTFKNVLNNKIIDNAFLEDDLYEQQTKDKRDSDEVTPEMIQDVQDLLSRFGIPYIIAPMEAEAQCATLMRDRLVDGVITDDSDVFLFGGLKVYKNMFSERNYVEYYDYESIYKNLGLDRIGMIELAQLLGSDYTNGIKGMGPVSGMEVIADFDSLADFRNWYNEGQFDKKKQEQDSKFRKDLRKRLIKNEVVLDVNFPSETVKNAYLNPEVENDKTEFVWGTPDLDMLRAFFKRKVGWPQEKTDEVMIPLIRDINKRKKEWKQRTLTEFFPTEYIQGQRKLNLGKRITNASGKLKRRKLR